VTVHLAVPFRVDALTGAPAVVTQDSIEDVAGCVEVVIGTRLGQRPLVPEFGTPDLLFSRDFHPSDVIADARRWEPRATLMVDGYPDLIDPLVRRVSVAVGTQERRV
jgi:phage baseplate assembly protein W